MISAGIVTYNPDIVVLKNNLESLCPQVAKVFIVDNGSCNVIEIEKVIKCFSNTSLFQNSVNYGIAQALNRLCRIAYQQKYDWILTMDQDSICDECMVQKLSEYISGEIGILAPRVEFRNSGVLIERTGSKEGVITENIRACITSGSLTNIRAWKEVGGFDEWYFIDHVDNEFCTHLLNKKYEIVRINNAVLYQRAGDMKYITIFGRPILLPYYSTFRNYYICRNTIYYIRKYHRDISLFLELRSFIYSQAIKLLFEKGRWSNLKSSLRGIRDGFKKKVESINYC